MNCKQNSVFDSTTEDSLTENDTEKDETTSEIDSLSKEEEFLQSNFDTSNSYLKCLVDTNTTNQKNECSELNLNPVVWQKFQFLISVLKDIQLNIQEMDSLIIDRHKKDCCDNNYLIKNVCMDASAEKASYDTMGNVVESSKTDETKLNEILCLLHRITDTLSAFEENPLLRDDLERRDNQETETKEPGNVNSATLTSDRSVVRRSCDDLKKIFGDDVPDFHTGMGEGVCEGNQVPPLCISVEGSSLPDGSGAIADEGVAKNTPSPRRHHFTKETKSLRSEIEAVVRRKELLDERLKRLIAERQQQRLQGRAEEEDEKDVDDEEKTASTEEMTVNFTFSQLSDNNDGRLRASSPEIHDSREERGSENEVPKLEDSANSALRETARNEAFIKELRNEEKEIPGLAGGGLSAEINSLNKTIRKILKENYELHTLCNEFSDRMKLKIEKRNEKHSQTIANGVDSKPVNSRKKKSKESICRKSSASNPGMTRTSFPSSGDSHTLNHDIDERSNPSPVMRSLVTSEPHLKASFDKKIRELLKEQTDMIKQLQTDKRAYDEKCYNLERMVSELTRINRETRSRLVEELQQVDLENCRLEDEVHALKRENWRLTKAGLRRNVPFEENSHSNSAARDASNQADCCDNESNSCNANKSTSSHEVCLGHIQRLLKEKEEILNDLNHNEKEKNTKKRKQHKERSQSLREGLYSHNISASHNDISSAGVVTNNSHRCSSLPVTLNEDDTDDGDVLKHMTDEEMSHASSTTGGAATSKNSEVTDLKNRMDHIEAFLNRQIHRENCENTKTSENDVSSLRQRVDVLTMERDAASKRMEELMEISRDLAFHFRVTREELNNAKREKHFLMEKLKARAEEKQIIETLNKGEDSSQYLSLITKLQERCHQLQLELERAKEEAHANALEKQRLTLEKEKLNRFLTSSLAHIEEENSRLQTSLRKLEEENRERSRESLNTEKSSSECRKTVEETSTESEETKEKGMNKITIVAQVHHEKSDPEKDVNEADDKSKEEEVNANWQRSLLWLQRCFAEEKLHSQLLEAAERENSARVAVLQETVQEKGEKYQELLTKYKKLHSMLLTSKFEKKFNKKILKECTAKIEEFNSTTTAIEDNYKVMLSSLGNNIGIAVEILSSHLFLTPSQVHPSPDLSVDPAFWFAAQCSRLRWLQHHLRKLCLQSWKGSISGDFPHSDIFRSKRTKKKSRERTSSIKDASFETGHPLDYVNTIPSQMCYVSRSSRSNISSPGRPLVDVSEKEQMKRVEQGEMPIEDKLKENQHNRVQEKYQEEDEEPSSSSTPMSLPSSILLSSMNDAEINLTNEQARLAQHKRSQFDALVGILKQNASPVVGRNSVPTFLASIQTFPPTPAAKKNSITDETHSIDNSLSEHCLN